MSTTLLKTTRLLALTAALLAAAPAHAILQDHGPADATLVWPQWYRDLGGTALGLCKSQAQSPNLAAGLAPMCFPIAPVATSFAGNVGDELFYNDLNVLVSGVNFTLRYTAALEAAYVPGPHPTHGQEVTFARLRWVMNPSVAGTYVVTHPFGIDVFPDVPVNGPRSLFATIDVPLGVPLDFEGALGSRVGPFIRWDVLNPGESLTVGTERFLGDPNFDHTYTGSPFGTNYVRVDGPAGSALDGVNDFIVQPLGGVLGQVWTAPIPTPFALKKAVYTRTATQNTIDLWATSAAGQRLIATGTDMPSIQLTEYPAGQYYGHIEESSALVPPATVTITNLTSVPTIQSTVQLADQIDAVATFNDLTGQLTVQATSSDNSNPTLVVVGVGAGFMISPATPGGTYTYSTLLPLTTEPPVTINVQSNAGGVYAAKVLVLPNGVNNVGMPVATSFIQVVSGSVATAIDLTTHVTVGGAFTTLVLTQPATGTAVATANGVTYTPNAGASGPDSFTYVVQDALGISNVGTISFVVPFTAPPPTAVANNFATQTNTARNLNVLANDVAGAGTVIDPLSVLVTGAGASFNPVNGGLVTYTAGAASGTFTFTYTVANANVPPTRSAPATVTMVSFGGPESVSVGRANYTISKGTWLIVGSTNWFSAALTQLTATCWLGAAAAPTASTLIGKTPIDTTGKFQLATVGTVPVPVNGQTVTCQSSSNGIGRTGTVAK